MTLKTIVKFFALIFIAGGILGLVYDSFSYTEATHDAKLGPIEFQMKEKKTVKVPQWVCIASIMVGTGLLVVPIKPG